MTAPGMACAWDFLGQTSWRDLPGPEPMVSGLRAANPDPLEGEVGQFSLSPPVLGALG
ncbi:MAG: hypothetical protein AAF631_10660 [Pseudomonadota bacterium]